MLKHNFVTLNKVTTISACIFFSLFACVNEIQTENENSIVPVTLSTRIQQNDNNAVENKFKDNDEIGVFILANSSNLDEKRYIDNMRFRYTTSNGFQPDNPIFFPEDGKTCDFISYYPFQDKGITGDGTTIEVKTHCNQLERDKFSKSDFMTAISTRISPTEQSIDLTFTHKLYKLNIVIIPEEGYTAQELLDVNPTVTIKDVYTQALYDFSDDTFKSLNTISDIVPYGNWIVEDEMLVGKSAILIPQKLPDQHIFIEIRIKNRDYQYIIDKNYELEKERPEDLIIRLTSNRESLKCTLKASIQGWGEPKMKEGNANEISTSVNINSLKFDNSYVYKVMSKGIKVAEITKEYLLSDNINRQAIVVYPMKDGKADLERGLVANIIDENNNKHGGNVIWTYSENNFIYSEGNSSSISHIYISEEGDVRTIRPENALQLQIIPETITDTRGTETIIYPIVKIGTQYWMKSNLKTSKYTDGSNINFSNNSSDTSASYFLGGLYYFYNSSAVNTGLISPDGWRVGNTTDWQQLDKYINKNASVLKYGTSWQKPAHPITNFSGFNAVATGYFKESNHVSERQQVCFWKIDNENQTTNGYLILDTNTNILKSQTNSNTLGLSIRCIRE